MTQRVFGMTRQVSMTNKKKVLKLSLREFAKRKRANSWQSTENFCGVAWGFVVVLGIFGVEFC